MVKLSVLLTTLCLQLAYGRRVPAAYGQQNVLDGDNLEDNEVSVVPEGNLRTNTPRVGLLTNYVEIERYPDDVNKLVGERVEFFCNASGSPPPLIQWYKGGLKLTENGYSMETNVITENLPAWAKVSSRLIIEHVLPFHQGVYYCEARTPNNVDRREFYLNVPNAESQHELNMTDLIKLNILGSFHPPRITFWAESYLVHLATDIVLPCKAHGNPLPEFYWMTPQNGMITKKEPREHMSVSSYGDLTIRKLSWQDMGLYTCLIQNREGSDSISTFLYPMKK